MLKNIGLLHGVSSPCIPQTIDIALSATIGLTSEETVAASAIHFQGID